MKCCFVYMTTADADEARRIGRHLVEARLAACANVIDGMEAIYEWEGKVVEGREAVLIVKTRESLVEALTAQVKAWHSYTCPCIVALPIVAGHEPYLDWLGKQTRVPNVGD